MELSSDWKPDVLITRPRIHAFKKSKENMVLIKLAIHTIIKDISKNYPVSEKMEDDDIMNAVSIIIEKFPTLSIEDFVIFKRRCLGGDYGEVFNSFGIPKLISWLHEYDTNEVVPARERLRHKQKIDMTETSSNTMAELVSKGAEYGFNVKAKKLELAKAINQEKKMYWYDDYIKAIDDARFSLKGNKLDDAIAEIENTYKYKLESFNKMVTEHKKLAILVRQADDKIDSDLKNKKE